MIVTDSKVVDLDDPLTWPQPVSDFAGKYAETLQGSTEFTSDLSGGLVDREDEFRSYFDGHLLLAFHATSLFDYEVSAIRNEGLRCLSRQLVERKIEEAHSHGAETFDQRDHCLQRNVYAIHNEQHREDQICLVVGRSIFDDLETGSGLRPFLGGWGGEATNGGPGPDEDPVLRALGLPAIVATRLGLTSSKPKAYVGPSLAKVFVGRALGLSDAFGSVHFHADIPGEDILAVGSLATQTTIATRSCRAS